MDIFGMGMGDHASPEEQKMKNKQYNMLKKYSDKYDIDLTSAKHLRNAHLIMKYKNNKLTKNQLEDRVSKSYNFGSPKESGLQLKFP